MAFETVPNEILLEIGAHLDPPSVVKFSLCCRRFTNCFAKQLIEYREASKNSLSDDHDPMTLPVLASLATQKHPHAWFLRTLEIDGTRRCWHAWKNYPEFDGSFEIGDMDHISDDEVEFLLNQGYEPRYDYRYLDGSIYSEEELKRYSEVLRYDMHLNPCCTAYWLNRLQLGDQEPLSVLVLATSPAISSLILAEHEDTDGSYPFMLFNAAISNLVEMEIPRLAWPVGFRSLQSIAINTNSFIWPSTGLWGTRCLEESSYICGMWHFESVFFLPNLKHLLLHGPIGYESAGWQCECGGSCDWRVPARSSSIQYLYIEEDNLQYNDCLKLFKSIKALKLVDIEGATLDERSKKRKVVQALIRHHGQSLERVNVAPETRIMSELDASIAAHQLKKCPELRYLRLSVGALQKLSQGDTNMDLHSELPPKLKILGISGVIRGEQDYISFLGRLRMLVEKRGSTDSKEKEGRLEDLCMRIRYQVSKDLPLLDPSDLIEDEKARSLGILQATLDHCERFNVKVHYRASASDKHCNHKDRHVDSTLARIG